MTEFVPRADASATIADFIEASGAAWAVHPDVINRAMSILTEFAETAVAGELVQGATNVEVTFDELNLDISCAMQVNRSWSRNAGRLRTKSWMKAVWHGFPATWSVNSRTASGWTYWTVGTACESAWCTDRVAGSQSSAP